MHNAQFFQWAAIEGVAHQFNHPSQGFFMGARALQHFQTAIVERQHRANIQQPGHVGLEFGQAAP